MPSNPPRCGYCGGLHDPCYQPIRHTWICPHCVLTFATAREQKAHVKTAHIDGEA